MPPALSELASEEIMPALIARPIYGSLRRAKSASAATGSAGAFLLLSAVLSFVPDRPLVRGNGWQLRGTLAPTSSESVQFGTNAAKLPAPAVGLEQTAPVGLPPLGKPV